MSYNFHISIATAKFMSPINLGMGEIIEGDLKNLAGSQKEQLTRVCLL